MHRAQDSTEARSCPLFLTSFTDQRTPAADQLINVYQLVLSYPMARKTNVSGYYMKGITFMVNEVKTYANTCSFIVLEEQVCC